MAEIKSTMDLVMERTRHLSLTDEEKAQQKKNDFQKHLKGLLQQYADEILSIDELLQHLASLRENLEIIDQQLVVENVCNRIEPGRDNHGWLDLLDKLAPGGRKPLNRILAEYNEQQQAGLAAAQKKLLADLDRRHGIKGPAVSANPQKDAAYRQSLARLKTQSRSRIMEICRRQMD